MSNLYRGPGIDVSYQVTVHLVKRFQRRRFFRNLPIRNKNCPWWPCLLTDGDEMSNHYRGPSIDASYQDLVHLVKQFQRRRFKCEKLTDGRTLTHDKSSPGLWPGELKISQSETKSNLWQPWLLTDRDEMCNLVRGPSIDASYQDLVPLVKVSEEKI